MKTIVKTIVIAGIFAASAFLGAIDASAQGRGGGHGGGLGAGPPGAGLRGPDRANSVAGLHGSDGRAIAGTRGANARGFCPPGQRKKAGLGSRFRC